MGMPEQDSSPYPVVTTGDGSLTFYSDEFGQAFHNSSGARQEAFEKFVVPCHLVELARIRSSLSILDICFGLGYNTGIAVERIWATNPTAQIQVIGLERSPDVPQQALQQGIHFGPPAEWARWVETGSVHTPLLDAQLVWGDARQTLQSVPEQWADAVFLDPFSPSACPELWTVEFLTLVAHRLKPQGRLATYSCGAAVRRALIAAGLHIGSTPPIGRPWPGTVASPAPAELPPLSAMELEHLQTRASIPYRDPTLQGSRDAIRRTRQQDQQHSSLEPTAQWKKRWSDQGFGI